MVHMRKKQKWQPSNLEVLDNIDYGIDSRIGPKYVVSIRQITKVLVLSTNLT